MLFARNRSICLTNRPFEGSKGAKLYAGLGGPDQIPYRHHKILDGRHPPLNPPASNDTSIATVVSPVNQFVTALPAAWWGRDDIWLQVRTFEGDHENESIHGPRNVALDGNGDVIGIVAGAANVLGVDVGSTGSATIRFVWTPEPNCAALTDFAAVWLSGPSVLGTLLQAPSGSRIQAFLLTGLSAGTYSFRLEARAGAVALVLATANVVIPAVPSTTATLTAVEH
ncbi:hypothetical protein [Schlesneria sp.]|uniref:hypothetical protein n=1 Tax=Schlesneria sp. TaxID=2762018 RepID=UPI003F821E7A